MGVARQNHSQSHINIVNGHVVAAKWRVYMELSEVETKSEVGSRHEFEPDIDGTELLKVVRSTLTNFLKAGTVGVDREPHYGRGTIRDPDSPEISGVFVTLWWRSVDGRKHLRGCIGRHARHFMNLTEEVADCALSAAVDDPRFPSVNFSELKDISIEINLLKKSERIFDPESELDPARYGVIIKMGIRQGTLLPGIAGIETIDQQLKNVREKAGIAEGDPAILHRFEVKKIVEDNQAPIAEVH